MHRSRVAGFALALALAPALFGLTARAADAAGPLVVRAGTLIDGRGGPPVRNAVIVIEGGRFAAVGPGVAVPPGARVVDLSQATVLPGFIDAHVHLAGRHLGEGEWAHASVRDTPQDDAIRGVRNARLTLEAGFTTVRNVGAGQWTDIALRDAIGEGIVPGPRIVAAGYGIGITGGHCDENGYAPGLLDRGPEHGIADGPGDAVRAVRSQIKQGADVIKICATGGVLSEGDAVGVQQMGEEELAAVVAAAHLAERRVAAHAHGTEGIKAALRAGVDSIEHGSMLDDEAIRFFLKTGAYLVPTLMAQETVSEAARSGVLKGERAAKALAVAPLARASIARAIEAGGKIALGTDAGVFPHGRNGREFALLVEAGMRPMDAILAGTRNAADLLGLGDEVGTVEPGKVADLVAVAGDPLADIALLTRPTFVLHAGVEIRGQVTNSPIPAK
jgi:imidazolonepropionase-like amidohydrolase